MIQDTNAIPADANKKVQEPSELESLQLTEVKYKVEKLQKECDFLNYQLSDKYKRFEHFKALSGLGSILAAMFTLFTIIFSVYTWTANDTKARLAKEEERFNSTLGLLHDDAPQKRLSAALSLTSFVNDDTIRNSQIILSLSNALGFESNELTRNTIIDIFRSLNFKQIDKITLRRGLTSLVGLNRTLTAQNELVSIFKLSEKTVVLDKLTGLSKAVEIFFRKGIFIEDLSATFFVGIDFSKLKLPPKTTFEGSTIWRGNFRETTCQNCNFKDGNFSGTDFTLANLDRSDFSYGEGEGIYRIAVNLNAFESHEGPKFDSAHLNGCNFENFPLLFIKAGSKIDDESIIRHPRFRSAEIRGADFSKSLYFVVTKHGEKQAPPPGDLTYSHEDGEKFNVIGGSIKSVYSSDSYQRENLGMLVFIFERSNWESAKMQDKMKEMLKVGIYEEYPLQFQ